ncbi:hypothetical protein WA158_002645 [Blastocystis sp. Blastoise]
MNSESRYQIDPEPFAEGGQGSVYLGRDRQTGETYVFKTYTKKREEQNEAMKRKLTIFKDFHSPFVIQYYDQITYKGVDYVVLEYCNGRSLRDQFLLKKEDNKKITREIIIEIATCVLWGLYDLHKAGIIHNDICPSNIFITYKGTIKIGDLDSCLKKEWIESNPFQQIDSQKKYKSPYVLSGSRMNDEKSDIWSLGITLLTLLNGSNPFTSDDTPSMLQTIYTGEMYTFLRPTLTDPDIMVLIRLLLNSDYVLQYNAEQLLEFPIIYERIQNIKECFRQIDELEQEYTTNIITPSTSSSSSTTTSTTNYIPHHSIFKQTELSISKDISTLSTSSDLSFSVSNSINYKNNNYYNQNKNNVTSTFSGLPLSIPTSIHPGMRTINSFHQLSQYSPFSNTFNNSKNDTGSSFSTYKQGFKFNALAGYHYNKRYSKMYIHSPLSILTSYKDIYEPYEGSDILVTPLLKDQFTDIIGIHSQPRLLYKRSGLKFNTTSYQDICGSIQRKVILVKCKDKLGNSYIFGGSRCDSWVEYLSFFQNGTYGYPDTDAYFYILQHPSIPSPCRYKSNLFSISTLYNKNKGPLFGTDNNHIIFDIIPYKPEDEQNKNDKYDKNNKNIIKQSKLSNEIKDNKNTNTKDNNMNISANHKNIIPSFHSNKLSQENTKEYNNINNNLISNTISTTSLSELPQSPLSPVYSNDLSISCLSHLPPLSPSQSSNHSISSSNHFISSSNHSISSSNHSISSPTNNISSSNHLISSISPPPTNNISSSSTTTVPSSSLQPQIFVNTNTDSNKLFNPSSSNDSIHDSNENIEFTIKHSKHSSVIINDIIDMNQNITDIDTLKYTNHIKNQNNYNELNNQELYSDIDIHNSQVNTQIDTNNKSNDTIISSSVTEKDNINSLLSSSSLSTSQNEFTILPNISHSNSPIPSVPNDSLSIPSSTLLISNSINQNSNSPPILSSSSSSVYNTNIGDVMKQHSIPLFNNNKNNTGYNNNNLSIPLSSSTTSISSTIIQPCIPPINTNINNTIQSSSSSSSSPLIPLTIPNKPLENIYPRGNYIQGFFDASCGYEITCTNHMIPHSISLEDEDDSLNTLKGKLTSSFSIYKRRVTTFINKKDNNNDNNNDNYIKTNNLSKSTLDTISTSYFDEYKKSNHYFLLLEEIEVYSVEDTKDNILLQTKPVRISYPVVITYITFFLMIASLIFIVHLFKVFKIYKSIFVPEKIFEDIYNLICRYLNYLFGS